ncbi:MAG: peptidyl-prolyl cis-trans isomerase [Candidatus Omnitrophica bacterium]|nr:peptidyl-prolyl cis-trans isomerase [Candidatus Omnitrophota bacterium]
MKRPLSFLMLCTLISVGPIWGESLTEKPSEKVIGGVSGHEISQGDFELFLRYKRAEFKQKQAKLPPPEELIRMFATDLILAGSLEATETPSLPESPLEWKLWELRNREAYTRILEEEMFIKGSLPESDLREYYDEHQQEFALTPSFSFRNIFLDATRETEKEGRDGLRKKAEESHRKLEALRNDRGIVSVEDFVGIASDAMGVPTREIDVRGDFQLGQINPVLEGAAYSLDPGEISDVIETKNGFYILRLENKVVKGFRPLEEVAGEIESRLRYKIQKERFIELRNRLTDPALSEVHEEGLAGLIRWATHPDDGEDPIVAEAEGFEIHLSDYLEFLKFSRVASPPSSSQSPEEIHRTHTTALVDNLLYPMAAYQHAVASGYTTEATFLNRMRIGLIVILGEEKFLDLVRQRVQSMPTLSEEEARTYYEKHPEEFMTTPTSRYREIAVRPREAANAHDQEFAFREAEARAIEVLATIKSGNAEEETIMKYSDGEEAQEGGLTPWLSPGRRYSPEVWKEIETLDNGEWMTEPMRERGYAILLKLEDLIPSTLKPFENVQGEVIRTLTEKRVLETTQSVMENLLEEHRFSLNPDGIEALKAMDESSFSHPD